MTAPVPQILIIEDEPRIRGVLRTLLESEGYRILEADTARGADIQLRAHKPDLLLVDLGLPDGDGLVIVREVRGGSAVPIIVLSARTQEEEKIKALDAGADDYVTKPFGAAELLARLRAALRRQVGTEGPEPDWVLGDLRIDPAGCRVWSPQGEVHLTPLERRLLGILAGHIGSVVTQKQLVREAWGPSRSAGDVQSLRVCIRSLREKLEPDPAQPRYLLTETGVGYRLQQDDAAAVRPASPDRTPDAPPPVAGRGRRRR